MDSSINNIAEGLCIPHDYAKRLQLIYLICI